MLNSMGRSRMMRWGLVIVSLGSSALALWLVLAPFHIHVFKAPVIEVGSIVDPSEMRADLAAGRGEGEDVQLPERRKSLAPKGPQTRVAAQVRWGRRRAGLHRQHGAVAGRHRQARRRARRGTRARRP